MKNKTVETTLIHNTDDQNANDQKRRQRNMMIVKAYPFALLLISAGLNFFVFGINPLAPALPAVGSIHALVVAAVLLVINHTWLMTTTELTRARFKMFATPEEWAASGTRQQSAPGEGVRELERHHNAHRNTTENTVYFAFLALIFVMVSPTIYAAYAWIAGFTVARLGYTYSYLKGKDGLRGLFMSLSLLAMYGMASYLAMSVLLYR